MATTIKLKNSVTTTATPTTLVQGEVATNITDKKLWVGNAASSPVQLIGTGASVNFTTVTTANDASISGLTVGKGGGAVASNTAVGFSAIGGSNSGVGVTAVGQYALTANTSGNYNAAFGTAALGSNTTGSSNTAIGGNGSGLNGSMGNNTTGSANTAVGALSLYSNTTASQNTAVGYQAGYSGTTASNYCTLVGYQAGYSNTVEVTHAFGWQALLNNSTGLYNTAVGGRSMITNTTGSYNVALGKETLYSNTTASNNTAVGYQSLYNSTGGNNTALGFYSGFTITTGSNNLNLGYNSGAAITTGTDNITIGFQAANWSTGITTGSGNIFIGTKSQPNANTDSGELVISTGTGAVTGKGTNTGYLYVNGSIYQGNNSATWSITSDQRLKKNIVDNNVGLDAISKIQVRNFEYRTSEEVTELEPSCAINIQGIQLGAIAQELQAILPDCVKTESTGVMSVDTTNLTWYLINAVKELNAKLEAQALEIATLKGK